MLHHFCFLQAFIQLFDSTCIANAQIGQTTILHGIEMIEVTLGFITKLTKISIDIWIGLFYR